VRPVLGRQERMLFKFRFFLPTFNCYPIVVTLQVKMMH
jgi:hypothetical protein